MSRKTPTQNMDPNQNTKLQKRKSTTVIEIPLNISGKSPLVLPIKPKLSAEPKVVNQINFVKKSESKMKFHNLLFGKRVV